MRAPAEFLLGIAMGFSSTKYVSASEELQLYFMALCVFAVIGAGVLLVVSMFITYFLLRRLTVLLTKVSGWLLEKIALVLLLLVCLGITLFAGYCWLRGGVTGLASELEKWRNLVH